MYKNSFVVLSVLAVCMISSGCWKRESAAHRVTGSSYSGEQDCVQAGGRWERGGIMQNFVCIFTYPDGGKDCKSSAECESQTCISNDEPNRAGYCKHNSSPFGCYRTIEEAERDKPVVCRD